MCRARGTESLWGFPALSECSQVSMCFTKMEALWTLSFWGVLFFFFLEVSKKWLTNWLNNWPLTILCNWFLLEYSFFTIVVLISTVQQNKSAVLLFSCGVVSDSLWPHGLRHARLLCPPLFPGVCSNLCPLSQWCYLTISSSAATFFCL